MSTELNYSDRGFAYATDIDSDYGGWISVYQSSSVDPKLWVRINSPVDMNDWAVKKAQGMSYEDYEGEKEEAVVHISLEAATQLVANLTKIIELG